jgi:hypothetical protein
MTLAPEHYLERASDLEAAADQVREPSVRRSYLELAQSFRDVANLASLSRMQSDAEAVSLAERMVGMTAKAR